MSRVLSNSDCLLVHLKKSELFESVNPSKILKAIAVGTPILMAVKEESSEIVWASGAGIEIEPESAEDLDEAIKRLKNDSALFQSLCEKERDFVATNYSRDRLADEYLGLIKRVARR